MTALHRSARYTDLVLDALRRFPERVAFRQDGRDLSYAQTADLLARWVTILRQRRFEPGQGIGVLSPNRPEVWLGHMTPVGRPDKKVLRARYWTGHARRVN